jgi:hypothetical protein
VTREVATFSKNAFDSVWRRNDAYQTSVNKC